MKNKSIAPNKSAQSPRPEHNRFIEYWHEQYIERYGMPYCFRGSIDGPAVKRLLKAYGFELACQLARFYLYVEDAYYSRVGRDLAKLFQEANALTQKMAAHHELKSPMTAAEEEAYYEQKRRNREKPYERPRSMFDD